MFDLLSSLFLQGSEGLLVRFPGSGGTVGRGSAGWDAVCPWSSLGLFSLWGFLWGVLHIRQLQGQQSCSCSSQPGSRRAPLLTAAQGSQTSSPPRPV